MASERRTERDSMGELRVPADAYYGAQTMRAVLNFPISDLLFPPSFIRALGQIKLAAAEVNRDLGLLDPKSPTRSSGPHRRSRTASWTTSSWSTSSRPARARRPT